MADKIEVGEVVAWLTARYPNASWPEATIRAWIEDMADVPADALRAAARAWYDAPHQWPPNGGELRAAAYDIMGGADAGWETGWLAWQRHVSECRQPEFLCRHDRSQIFDPVTHHTVEAMGWQTLCRMEMDQVSTIRAQFRDIWRAEAARQVERDRRHPAVQQVVDAYRARIETRETPRIEAADTAEPQGIRAVLGDIDKLLDAGGRPRRAELDAIIRRVAAQRGGVL